MPSASIEDQQAHWIEWVTGGVSTLLVLAMIGFIFWDAVTDRHLPPDLGVTITSRAAVAGGYRVTFDVTNRSSTTAAGVVVKGELVGGDHPLETTEVTFDYVPAQSRSSGAVLFSRDPAGDTVRIRASGYTDP